MNLLKKKRKWLVVGASGQLGREWSLWLEKKGENVRALSRKKLDITLANEVESSFIAFKPDIVVNCAAYTHVDEAEKKKDEAEQINHYGARVLAEACARYKATLLHYSTDYVFPGLFSHRKQMPKGYPETFPPEPVNAYGWSKWKGEEAVRSSGASFLILRLSWLCGEYGNNFIHTMLRLARERKHLKVVNDQYGSPTFTLSAVKNSIALAEAGTNGLFHLSSKGETTWYKLAKAVFEQKKMDVEILPISTEEYPTPAKRPAWSLLDTQMLLNVPGTEMGSWEEELRIYLDRMAKSP